MPDMPMPSKYECPVDHLRDGDVVIATRQRGVFTSVPATIVGPNYRPTVQVEIQARGDELVIAGSELQVGDVIVDHLMPGNRWYSLTYARWVPYEVVSVDPVMITWHDIKPRTNKLSYPIDKYLVLRTSGAVVAKGDWNGKCPRCGRGTYTGFLQVEHEGGTCHG